MYDIIKKALDEALSEQYAAQLMGAADESYSFSPVFEKKMKILVKKTDKPYIKYVKYLGAAACAAVAVGCSILMPKLIQQNVPVETTTSATISAVPVEEPPITTTRDNDAVLPPTSGITPTENEPTESETTTVATSAPNKPDIVTSYPENENPDSVLISSATSEIDAAVPTDDEFPGRGDDLDLPVDVIEDEAVDSDDDMDIDVNDEDTFYDDEENCYEDEDWDDIGNSDDYDDAEWDDAIDDSDDEDADYDDDVDDSDNDSGDNVITRPAIPKENTLGAQVNTLIGCRLSESYPYRIILTKNGENYNFSDGLTIPETAERFRDKAIAEKLEKAELITDSFEVSDRYITVEISDVSPTLWNGEFTFTRSAYDFSPRNNYNILFHGETNEESDVDEDDYADIEYTTYKTCTLIMYDNGVIAVNSYEYSGTMYFRTDKETSDEIFSRAERNIPHGNIAEAPALLKAVADSESDIKKAYLCTTGTVYDIRMGAPCDGKYLYDLLKNYASGAVMPTGTAQRSNSLLSFSFVSTKTAQSYSVILYSDSKAELRTQQNCGYLFSLPLEKTLDTLDYLCSLNGKPAATRYANLREYLEGKNFTGFSYLGTTDYSTVETDEGTNIVTTDITVYGTDSKASKKVTELILQNASISEYVPSRVKSENERYILAKVPDWSASVSFRGDFIIINNNTFRLPDGLGEKIFMAMYETGNKTVKNYAKNNDLLYYNLNNGNNIYEQASSDSIVKTLGDDVCSWLGGSISECTIDEASYYPAGTDKVYKIYPDMDFSAEYIMENLLNVISDAEYENDGALDQTDIFLSVSYNGKRCHIWLNAGGNAAAEFGSGMNKNERIYLTGKKAAESIKRFLDSIKLP